MRLTEAQVQQFKEEGFLLLPAFAEPELCDTIHDIAKAHLKHKVPPLETEFEYVAKSKEERERISDAHSETLEKRITVRRLRQVYHRDIVFKEWMEHRKMRPVLQQILGEAPTITIAHHNSIMTKMPQSSTATSWHQDFRYWNFEDDNLVSVWLALDSENDKNGVLEFIPGSHKMSFTFSQFDEKEYFSETNEDNKEIIATKVSYELKKGDVVLFHCKLLHRANKNRTDEAKISFVYTVKGASTKVVDGTRSAEYPEIELEYL